MDAGGGGVARGAGIPLGIPPASNGGGKDGLLMEAGMAAGGGGVDVGAAGAAAPVAPPAGAPCDKSAAISVCCVLTASWYGVKPELLVKAVLAPRTMSTRTHSLKP
jgi:hypothetical protein